MDAITPPKPKVLVARDLRTIIPTRPAPSTLRRSGRRQVGFTPPGHAARASFEPSMDCRDPMAWPGDGNGAPPAMRFQCLAVGAIAPRVRNA